ARAAVTPSPEPFSNMALSVGEDATAIGLTWFATRHPYWSAVIAVAFVIAAVVMIRMVARAIVALLRRGLSFSRRPAEPEVAEHAPPAA
ncbi:MAG TPA: DUF4126 domain-containing protein, partial [Terriglobales bacterium]|nr:DUF4126 domain-containing protein [Terriglobales bacterium]